MLKNIISPFLIVVFVSVIIIFFNRSSKPGTGSNIDETETIVVVSDFSQYPLIKKVLLPLFNLWGKEGKTAVFFDVNSSHSEIGRDAAEKLRNGLAKYYRITPFKYLFLVDVYKSSGPEIGRHVVPVRLFTDISFVDPIKVWNDYYFSDLFGKFDLNQNGTFEIGGNNDYQPIVDQPPVIVGRILFEDISLEKQLEKYVSSDILFRRFPLIQKALMVKAFDKNFRESNSTHWPLGDQNEERQTLDKAFSWNKISKKTILNGGKLEILASLGEVDLVYFYGHGGVIQQQYKSIDPLNDSSGEYFYVDELTNAANIKRPVFAFFQGCETGRTYSEGRSSNCSDVTLCFSTIPIAEAFLLNNHPSSVAGLASVANSIAGDSHPSDYADLLQGAFWHMSLAEQVTIRNRQIFSETGLTDGGRMSLIYFGDPTLPFPFINKQDIVSPRIEFDSDDPKSFIALDDESGLESVDVFYDGNSSSRVESIFPNSPLYLNHVGPVNVLIQARDRAGNFFEIKRTID